MPNVKAKTKLLADLPEFLVSTLDKRAILIKVIQP